MATPADAEKSLDSITSRSGVRELVPTLGDVKFVQLYQDGGYNRVEAFMLAFPENQIVDEYNSAIEVITSTKDSYKYDINYLEKRLRREANNYFNRTRVQLTMTQYKERMTVAAGDAIDIARDIMMNGRSEMVRAQLAQHFMNHEVGTPVHKIAVSHQKTVRITVGTPQKVREIIDGEIVNESVE